MSRPPLPIGTYGRIRCTRSGKSWVARAAFRDYDGVTRDVERTGPTKTLAENRLKEALRDRAKIAASGEIGSDSRFADLVEAWWRQWLRKPHSPRSEETYRSCVDNHVLPALGELRCREVTTARVTRVINEIEDRIGAPTAKTARSILLGIGAYGAQNDVFAANPVRDAPSVTVKKKTVTALTIPQVKQLLAFMTYDPKAISRDLADFVAFLAATGVRQAEALGVRWCDIDFEAGTVTIRHQVTRRSVRGRPRHRVSGDGGGLLLKAPKSEAGVRVFRLPTWALRMLELRRLTAGEPRIWPTVGILQPDGSITEEQLTADTAMVFPSTRFGTFGPRDPHNVHRQVKEAFAFAGLDITCHKFRKTVATAMDQAGLEAKEVAEQLGHADERVTKEHYIARKLRVASAAAEVLEPIGDLWA